MLGTVTDTFWQKIYKTKPKNIIKSTVSLYLHSKSSNYILYSSHSFTHIYRQIISTTCNQVTGSLNTHLDKKYSQYIWSNIYMHKNIFLISFYSILSHFISHNTVEPPIRDYPSFTMPSSETTPFMYKNVPRSHHLFSETFPSCIKINPFVPPCSKNVSFMYENVLFWNLSLQVQKWTSTHHLFWNLSFHV